MQYQPGLHTKMPKKALGILCLFLLMAGIALYLFTQRTEPIMGAWPYLIFIAFGSLYLLLPHKTKEE